MKERIRVFTIALVTAAFMHLVSGNAIAQTPAQPGQPHRIVVLADNGSLRVLWEVNGNVQWTSYRLDFLSSLSGPVVASVIVGPARDVTFGLPSGTQGSFWVTITGRGDGTESTPSLAQSFRIGPTSCSGSPAPPTNLSGAITNRVLTITWQPSAGASEYWLEAGSASAARDFFDGSVGEQRGLSAAVPANLVAFIRVRAQNPCGRSGPSNEIRVAEEAPGVLQRWVGQTVQGQEISFEIDSTGVRTVHIRGTVSSAVPQCHGEQAWFPWSFNPTIPIVNGQVTLSGENPERTIAFRVTAAFTATSASGTLEVTLRKPGAFCEGSLSTTWNAVRQQ